VDRGKNQEVAIVGCIMNIILGSWRACPLTSLLVADRRRDLALDRQLVVRIIGPAC